MLVIKGNKLQGKLQYTYLRRGGVVNNQIKKRLLLSLPMKKYSLQSVNIWQSYKQECRCLVCTFFVF